MQLEQLAKLDPDLGEPDNEDGEAFIEAIEKLNSRLDENCRQVLAMKIDGLTHEEIADHLDRSTKSVTRYVNEIKKVMKDMYETDG